jgi:TRAP-type C4-dicarboxylate transport system substrate-binding protein
MRFSSIASIATFMNKFTYDSLSPAHQEIIRGIGVDVIDFYAKNLQAADEAALAKMKGGDDPIKFYEFSAADNVRMSEASQSMITKWKRDAVARGLDADALLNDYNALVVKWKKIHANQGYPWDRK